MGLKLNSITIADRVIRKEEKERERERRESRANKKNSQKLKTNKFMANRKMIFS